MLDCVEQRCECTETCEHDERWARSGHEARNEKQSAAHHVSSPCKC